MTSRDFRFLPCLREERFSLASAEHPGLGYHSPEAHRNRPSDCHILAAAVVAGFVDMGGRGSLERRPAWLRSLD
jgi:hypothetical protein